MPSSAVYHKLAVAKARSLTRGRAAAILATSVACQLSDCAEFEISLERGPRTEASAPDSFIAQIRVNVPASDAEDRLSLQGLELDREALRICEQDPARYGRILTTLLFGHPDARAAFTRARVATEALRIRLSFGPTATDLHDLRWETLRDPDRPDSSLLTDPRIYFSRYLSSFDWRPVRLRPREVLRALVVVANPADLPSYRLAAIDCPGQLELARRGLPGIIVTALTSDPQAEPPQRVTLARILEALQTAPDILYLVCHGKFDRKGQSSLFLEGDNGATVHVRGVDLIQGILDLEQRPRLVVLASCEGAGSGDGSLVALGPRLAEAGVPAVLAMQGLVQIRTVEQFFPVFFRELVRDGHIDRALAVARGAITDPDESWRPTLFMRLKRGRLWYDAGFAVGGLGNWDAIRMKIDDGECTPILGPGLFETIFEVRPWMARRWAQEYFFPLAPAQREDLTAVAQYLASRQGADFPHKKLLKDLAVALTQRIESPDPPTQTLSDLLAAARTRRFTGQSDPYSILAGLPLPVFIVASQDPLLVQALRAGGKRPRVGVLPWRRGIRDPLPPNFEPTVDEPLVYHLFGTFDAPRSLVLTQDDYFDFLLSVSRLDIREAIPKVVLERLIDSSLLFLGFHIDSWEFRAVFRTVMQQEGMESSRGPHVAAQVEPEEGRVLDPAGARTYFERYLRGAAIDIYWGTAEGFLADLARTRDRSP